MYIVQVLCPLTPIFPRIIDGRGGCVQCACETYFADWGEGLYSCVKYCAHFPQHQFVIFISAANEWFKETAKVYFKNFLNNYDQTIPSEICDKVKTS